MQPTLLLLTVTRSNYVQVLKTVAVKKVTKTMHDVSL